MVKTVSYQHTNSYEILYPVTPSTQNIWLCFHGIGYLATYFKRYFEQLDPTVNAVIIPQAPSKFYLGEKFKHVGASWLTRVDTQQEMRNNLNYIDSILELEQLHRDARLIIMGYSQGVSIAMRYLKHYNYKVKALIMHSGSIPVELQEEDGLQLRSNAQRIIHIAGTQDEYLSPAVIDREEEKIDLLFKERCEIHRPNVKHVVDTDTILHIAQSL